MYLAKANGADALIHFNLVHPVNPVKKIQTGFTRLTGFSKRAEYGYPIEDRILEVRIYPATAVSVSSVSSCSKCRPPFSFSAPELTARRWLGNSRSTAWGRWAV